MTIGQLWVKGLPKTMQRGGLLITAGGFTYIGWNHLKRTNKTLMEYYNKELNVVNQLPSPQLTKLLIDKIINRFGYEVEHCRIFYGHTNNKMRKQLISVFLDEDGKGLDIYLPQYFEYDCSVGHFLEKAESYFNVGDYPLNTNLRDTTPNRLLVDKVICATKPTNEQILQQIAEKIYYTKSTNTFLELTRSNGVNALFGGLAVLMAINFKKINFLTLFSNFKIKSSVLQIIKNVVDQFKNPL